MLLNGVHLVFSRMDFIMHLMNVFIINLVSNMGQNLKGVMIHAITLKKGKRMKTIKSENGKPDARKVGTITNIKEVYVTEDCSSILGLKIEFSMNHDGAKTYGEQIFVNSDLLAYLSDFVKKEEKQDE